MPFVKGKSGNPKGRKEGTTNKLTRSVKEALKEAFDNLQAHPTANLIAWGEKNPTVFYQIAAKLIPTEIQAQVEQKNVKVIRE